MLKTIPSDQAVVKAADLLAAMANEKRLLILMLLSTQEMSVGELAAAVELSQSALSQHLAKLRKLSLVSVRRDAQTLYYSSRSAAAHRIIETLAAIYSSCAA